MRLRPAPASDVMAQPRSPRDRPHATNRSRRVCRAFDRRTPALPFKRRHLPNRCRQPQPKRLPSSGSSHRRFSVNSRDESIAVIINPISGATSAGCPAAAAWARHRGSAPARRERGSVRHRTRRARARARTCSARAWRVAVYRLGRRRHHQRNGFRAHVHRCVTGDHPEWIRQWVLA
jgi:hypothetical protein